MSKHEPTTDLPRVVSQLRTAATWVEVVAPSVLIATPPVGVRTESLGIRGSDVSRPTEAAALGDKKENSLYNHQVVMLELIATLYRDAGIVIDALGELHASLDLPALPVGADKCKQRHCDSTPKRGCAGNCGPCYQYLWRHPELDEVPSSVIEARARRR